MSRRFTWLLGFAAAALLGFVFFVEPRFGEGRAAPGGYALRFDPADVTALEISRPGETLRFTRVPGGWVMGPAPSDRASAAEVEKILYLAQNLAVIDRIGSGEFTAEMDKEYGFAPSRVSLAIETPQGKRSLAFGREGAAEGRVFVRAGDSRTTLLVPDGLLAMLLRPAVEYRDLRLVALPAGRIDRVQIRRPDGDIALERDGAGWKLRRPLQARADTEKIDSQLEMLLGARIHEFLDGDAAAEPRGELAEISLWEEGDDEPLVLSLTKHAKAGEGAAAEEMLAVRHSRRASPMLVSAENAALATMPLQEMRARNLLETNPDLIDRFRVSLGGVSLEFERDTSGFRSRDGGGRIGEGDFLGLLGLLREEKVEKYLLAGASQAADEEISKKPDALVVFSSWLSENTPETEAGPHAVAGLQFWKSAASGKVLVRTDEDASLREISGDFLERLAAWMKSCGKTAAPESGRE